MNHFFVKNLFVVSLAAILNVSLVNSTVFACTCNRNVSVNEGTSITVYEQTGSVYAHTFQISSIKNNPATFTTNANETYTVSLDGDYVKIHCYRAGDYSGTRVGNNIAAVKLSGLDSDKPDLWASTIHSYQMGSNGISESRFNALGNVDATGPYDNKICTYMGDHDSELVLGFETDGACGCNNPCRNNCGNKKPTGAKPTVNLTLKEPSACGQKTVLNWISTGADSCYAAGSWNGNMATNGSQNIDNFSGSRIYTLTCVNEYGSTRSSVTVSNNGANSCTNNNTNRGDNPTGCTGKRENNSRINRNRVANNTVCVNCNNHRRYQNH